MRGREDLHRIGWTCVVVHGRIGGCCVVVISTPVFTVS